MQWKPEYALVLLGVTAITYFSAIIIENKQVYQSKKLLIYTGAILALLPLLVFKYTGFITEILTNVILKDKPNSIEINIIAPIGISFYTFQSVGYLFDVYNKRIKAERNWWDYMLFVCFFPQILSGPISRAQDLLPQIKSERTFDYSKSVQALKWILWGMFVKVVMADRLGIYVDTIFANYDMYSGLTCFFASICYSLQIYGDFAGYSLMAMGVARLMGFDLINNFNHPYLATSITDFWKRWHISLTKWLTTHVYIAMGGNRCSKLRQYWNIMVTFLVSGIWHGANWTFILWGSIHGIFQIIEKALGLQKCEGNWFVKLLRIIITFLIVNFAWIIFRSPDIFFACDYIVRIFTDHSLSLYSDFGVTPILFHASIAVVLIKDIIEEFSEGKMSLLNSKYLFVRWATYISLLVAILLCGVLDSGSFIYVNF
jgi:D-alanyl-lipoteichoic acid acyltransferase DltB (MBOAT superfamily)